MAEQLPIGEGTRAGLGLGLESNGCVESRAGGGVLTIRARAGKRRASA